MLIGVITGMAAEAACFKRSPGALVARAGGADPERTNAIAREFCETGAVALVSFGIAGGLDPRQESGDLLIADQIVGRTGVRYRCDREWRRDLVGFVRGTVPIQVATIASSVTAVTTAAAKRDLRAETGAAAVDMESDIVAAVADSFGVPFLAVRAIADPAARAVPPWALAGIGPDGRTRMLLVLRSLLRRPREISALLALGGDFRRALSSLRTVAAAVGPAYERRGSASPDTN
jgi:adenosylhomocysteine nucleosidase